MGRWRYIYSSTGSSGAQSGSGSPEWLIVSKKIWDQYLDTNTDILYFNPVKWATTGRQIIQSAPAN